MFNQVRTVAWDWQCIPWCLDRDNVALPLGSCRRGKIRRTNGFRAESGQQGPGSNELPEYPPFDWSGGLSDCSSKPLGFNLWGR